MARCACSMTMYLPEQGMSLSRSQLIMPYAPMMSSTANCSGSHKRGSCRLQQRWWRAWTCSQAENTVPHLVQAVHQGYFEEVFPAQPPGAVERSGPGPTLHTHARHSSRHCGLPGGHEVIPHHGCNEIAIVVGPL